MFTSVDDSDVWPPLRRDFKLAMSAFRRSRRKAQALRLLRRKAEADRDPRPLAGRGRVRGRCVAS